MNEQELPIPKVENWQMLYEPNASVICIRDDPPMKGFGRRIKKGDVFGGARISTKHVLALTNAANATAQDIASLAKSAQQHVQDKFGITLEPEVNLIGLNLQ